MLHKDLTNIKLIVKDVHKKEPSIELSNLNYAVYEKKKIRKI